MDKPYLTNKARRLWAELKVKVDLYPHPEALNAEEALYDLQRHIRDFYREIQGMRENMSGGNA